MNRGYKKRIPPRTSLGHPVILEAGASRAAFPQGEVTGRRLPLMNDLVKATTLDALLETNGISWKGGTFESIYAALCRDPKQKDLVERINRGLQEYFAAMLIPEQATLYDRLLLALEPKDMIASFNWDPLLLQAYRRNAYLKELPEIVFLHGCVEQGVCYDCSVVGYLAADCNGVKNN